MLTTDPKDMTEAEREAHIGDCGRLIESEMAAGNREAAMSWLQDMPEDERFAAANSYLGLLRQASHSHADQAFMARLLRRRGHVVAGDLGKIFRRAS